MSTNLFPLIVPRIESYISYTHSRQHRNEWDPQAQRVNTFATKLHSKHLIRSPIRLGTRPQYAGLPHD